MEMVRRKTKTEFCKEGTGQKMNRDRGVQKTIRDKNSR